MGNNAFDRRFRRVLTTVVVGFALVGAGAPAASAIPDRPAAAVAAHIASGSSSGSGYLLEAALNALCLLTGSKPSCWSSAPTL
ncbi:hypothetical protein [Nocardia sp. NPDC003963]